MLPYRSDLKHTARHLRRNATVPERLLWSRLRRRALGVRILRQRPIGRYVVDFFCPERQLVIEVDGRSHEGHGEADAERQRFLEEKGLFVYRIPNDEILKHLDETVRQLEAWIQQEPPKPVA